MWAWIELLNGKEKLSRLSSPDIPFHRNQDFKLASLGLFSRAVAVAGNDLILGLAAVGI